MKRQTSKRIKQIVVALVAMMFSFVGCKEKGNHEEGPNVKEISFALSSSVIYEGGECVIQDIVVKPENAVNKEVNFYIEDPEIVSIAGLTISGLKKGETKVVGVSDDNNKIKFSVPIKVIEIPPIEVTGIDLAFDTNSIYVDEMIRANVSVLPYNATNQEYDLVASNDNVSIDGNKVTGVKAGPVSIYAVSKANSKIKSQTSNIIVKNVPATGIKLTADSTNLIVGGTTQLHAEVLPNNAFDKEVLFRTGSGKSNIISINNGVVTAVSSGTDSVVAYLKNNTSIVAELFFAVTNAEPTGIDISASKTTLYLDEAVQLSHTVYPSNGFNYSVSYETQSGNNNIISVSNEGVVVGVSAGEDYVVAYLTQRPSIRTTLKITVLNQTNPDDPFGDDIFTED